MNNKNIFTIDTKTIFSTILIVLLFLGLWLIRDIILIILTAVVIASLTEVFVRSLKKIKIPRIISVIIFYIIIIVLFGGILYLFIPVFISEIALLRELYPGLLEQFNISETITIFQNYGNNLPDLISRFKDSPEYNSIFRSIVSMFGGLVNFLLLFVVSFYISIQERGIEKFLKILSPASQEEYIISIWRRTKKKIGDWFKSQLIIAVIVFILTYIGLGFLSVPYALLLALLAGIFGLIPYGIVLATIPALLIGFTNGGFNLVLLMFLMYLLIQLFLDYIIQPLIIKRFSGVPSVMVILAIIIAVKFVGFLGLILAIPVSVFVLELIEDHEKKKKYQMRISTEKK